MRVIPEKDMNKFSFHSTNEDQGVLAAGFVEQRECEFSAFLGSEQFGLKLGLWKEDLTQLKQGLYQA
jgi:hypothetical protein